MQNYHEKTYQNMQQTEPQKQELEVTKRQNEKLQYARFLENKMKNVKCSIFPILPEKNFFYFTILYIKQKCSFHFSLSED